MSVYYFDNNATTRVADEVFDEMKSCVVCRPVHSVDPRQL